MTFRTWLVLGANALATLGVPLFLLVNQALPFPGILLILACNLFCLVLLAGVIWKGKVLC